MTLSPTTTNVITHLLTQPQTHSLTHSLTSYFTQYATFISSGQGRTLAGEDLLVRRLNEAGAAATKCCDYAKVSFEEQITLAYQADVVMGIHGAALTHAVFGPRGKHFYLPSALSKRKSPHSNPSLPLNTLLA